MKKIILLSICLLIGAWTLRAQQTIYIIDNETVENFDGSQLKDRTIRDYKITTKGSGRNAITVHAITTSSSVFSVTGSFTPLKPLTPIDSSIVIKPTHRKIIYVIDGVPHEDAVIDGLGVEDGVGVAGVGGDVVKDTGLDAGVVPGSDDGV